jgi:hypothetical protein
MEDFNLEDYQQTDHGYGFCPVCGLALENFGAASHGDGDIFDEIDCPDEWCDFDGYEIHADYCQCSDCGMF